MIILRQVRPLGIGVRRDRSGPGAWHLSARATPQSFS